VTSKTYTGLIDGVVDIAAAKEIRLWVDSKLMAPLGRFKLAAVKGGKLRSDIAALWSAQVQVYLVCTIPVGQLI